MSRVSCYKFFFITFIIIFSVHFHIAKAENIKYDLAFDEFILKNSYTLISQFQKQSGEGFQSIKKQLHDVDCDIYEVLSPKLLNTQDPYLFYKTLLNSTQNCRTDNARSIGNNTYKDLHTLLENKEVYLLIAGETLDSPMSYFGHSLLVFLDPNDFYFSPVVSILAPIDEENILTQTFSGGFSRIDAELTVSPLHQVISFYNNKESRPLQFIKLSDTTFEKEKLIHYLDNKLPKNLDYNFFLNNCSTYLYRALQYACNCFDENKLFVSPAYLAKKVHTINSSNLFELSSLFKKFKTNYSKLSLNEQNAVKNLVIANDNKPQKSHIGHTAALASQLTFEAYHRPYPSYTDIMKQYGDKIFLLDKLPEKRKQTDKDLDNLNLSSIGLTLSEKKQLITLSIVDYNDNNQRQAKFVSSKMSAGVFEVQRTMGRDTINSLTLIDISTIKPISFIDQQSSWRFKIGAERDEHNELAPFFTFGIGAAVSTAAFKLYSIPTVDIKSTTRMRLNSGIEYKNNFLSLSYESNDFKSHEVTAFHRSNSSIGYKVQFKKESQKNSITNFSVFYYF